MTNKMEARDLFYVLGLLSYGDTKLAKWKIMIMRMVFQAWFMETGFCGCCEEWYHFQ